MNDAGRVFEKYDGSINVLDQFSNLIRFNY